MLSVLSGRSRPAERMVGRQHWYLLRHLSQCKATVLLISVAEHWHRDAAQREGIGSLSCKELARSFNIDYDRCATSDYQETMPTP